MQLRLLSSFTKSDNKQFYFRTFRPLRTSVYFGLCDSKSFESVCGIWMVRKNISLMSTKTSAKNIKSKKINS